MNLDILDRYQEHSLPNQKFVKKLIFSSQIFPQRVDKKFYLAELPGRILCQLMRYALKMISLCLIWQAEFSKQFIALVQHLTPS